MNKSILMFLVVAGAVFSAWKWIGSGIGLYLGTPELLGGVVRVDDPEKGDRLYYLTSQWEKRVTRFGGSRNSSLKTLSWVNTDLWEIDAATAQPVSRKRIKRAKINADHKALGVEKGVMWARVPELVGIRLSDGVIVADKAKIEARNPSLAGFFPDPSEAGTFLPDSMQPSKFDPQAGMIVRLDDARLVRIDPLTLEAAPHSESKSEKDVPSVGLKMISVSSGMDWWAMVRGLTMPGADGKDVWLGLLAENELEQMRQSRLVSPQMDFTVPRRHKLYRAQMERVEEFYGSRWAYGEPAVLPESPEFLMAGLLTQSSGSSDKPSALWRREPDSVFVLSRDRLGDEGRMQVARVSGPKGAAVWTSALPISNMSAWVPGERHAMMLGPDPSAPRWPKAEDGENPVMQMVAIDLTTGDVKSFNPDLHRDFPVQGKPKGE